MLAALFLVSAVNVFAHAKLESSVPKTGEVVAAAPERVSLIFSVPVQPVMSTITVTDDAGKRFEREAVFGDDGNKVLSVAVWEMGPGRYRVDWRALSADDHMISGEFTFEVRGLGDVQAPIAAPSQSEVDHSQMDHSMHETPAEINWIQSLIRWLMYMAMLTLAGAFAFRLFVVRKAAAELAEVTSQEIAGAALAEQERRFLSGALLSCMLLLFAGVAALIFQSSAIFETSVIDSMSPSQLQRVITETSFGSPWALQMSWAVAAMLFIILMRAGRRGALMWLGLAASVIILLTPSLTGHARAAYTDYSFAIVSDWIHLMAAAVWVGGLIQIAMTVPAMLNAVAGRERTLLLSAIISNFNKMAMVATGVIVLTGLYNSWIHVDSLSALLNSTYGLTLIFKVALSFLMILLGGINAFVLHPKIKRSIADTDVDAAVSPRESGRFLQSVRIEIALAIIVLLLAAILAFLPPAREHSMPAQNNNSSAAFARLG